MDQEKESWSEPIAVLFVMLIPVLLMWIVFKCGRCSDSASAHEIKSVVGVSEVKDR